MAVCSEYIGMNSEHLDPNNLEEIKPLRNQLDLSESRTNVYYYFQNWSKSRDYSSCHIILRVKCTLGTLTIMWVSDRYFNSET